MLQFIRDKATGWIAWVVVILIAIPFALWGIQEYVTPDVNPTVVSVNGDQIEYQTFYRSYQRRLSTLRRILPDTEIDEAEVRQQTLDDLIDEQVLIQAALDGQMRIGDGLLAALIRSNRQFQRDGEFSQELYQNFLRANGMTPGSFEFEMRRNLLSQQILSGINGTALVSDAELKTALELRTQTRRYSTLEVPGARFMQDAPSDEAVQAYFDGHREIYRQPQLVTAEYVQISRDEIASGISATDEGLRELYQRNLNAGMYATPEQRAARHILITLADDAEPAEVEKALEKIKALRDRIVDGGESFESVAKSESEDPGSAPNGGDLGLFGRGVMDPAFETAAFALKLDEVSEPVRSRFGWHLIQVTEIQPGSVRSFEQTRAEILREYQNLEAEQVFGDRVEQLANLSFERPDTLAPAAEALGLEIRTSEPFSRDEPAESGIARFESVRAHAFRPNVLDGENSDLIETDPGVIIVLRVSRVEPSRLRELDEVRAQVVAAVQVEAATASSKQLGEALLKRLESGEEREAVAEAESLSWSEPESVTRQSGAVDGELRDALFKLPAPEADRPRYIGLPAAEGGYRVIALLGVGKRELDEAELTRLQIALGDALRAQYGRAEEKALLAALRANAKVEIFKERLSPGEE
ncbi:MAG: SurA N-terminal domain-containing protein [Gammaproteobacteria bacterium]|nr:SurA N-terminal domain-containing protein [Gammaproteobacteria bacterium]